VIFTRDIVAVLWVGRWALWAILSIALAFAGKRLISSAMAKLYFYYASMNAGKSTTLL